MPFKSKVQQKWAFATHQPFAKDWAAVTNEKALPERKGKMAKKKNWIKKAINPKHKGALKKKAKAAGQSTAQFIAQHKNDSGQTGAQARLAVILMGMPKKSKPANVKAMYRQKSAR